MDRFSFKTYELNRSDLCRALSSEIDKYSQRRNETMGDKTFTLTVSFTSGEAVPADEELRSRINDALIAAFDGEADIETSIKGSVDSPDELSERQDPKQAEDALHQEAMAKAKKMPDSALDPIKQYSSEETKFWYKYELALDELSRRSK